MNLRAYVFREKSDTQIIASFFFITWNLLLEQICESVFLVQKLLLVLVCIRLSAPPLKSHDIKCNNIDDIWIPWYPFLSILFDSWWWS